jgi:23S rRNA (adenine2503-C2)-methyltransferase
MPALVDYEVKRLEEELLAVGENPVHAGRVLRQFYELDGRIELDALSISHGAVRYIQQHISGRRSRIAKKNVAADGTTKLLVGFGGSSAVEAVLMPGFRPDIAAACVSSQIGCAMGCDFCASTRGGLERNLEAGEIVEQFLHLRELAASLGRRLKTLVFMGMGEPLLNYDAVMSAIGRIADRRLGAFGCRRITVSTVGIVPGIERLIDSPLKVSLALSLHAPDDATRSRLVPANRRYAVAEVMAAARRFDAVTGRTPNIEYCLLAGVNDSEEQAELLAELMRNFRAHVNLIPYNPIGPGVSGITYSRPSEDRIRVFMNILRSRGVVTHIRVPRGDNVNAACGQLRETVAAENAI